MNMKAYFYAPIEYAGRIVEFTFNGKEYSAKFVSCEMIKNEAGERVKKKDLVLEILKSSDTALTVDEILERINEKCRVYLSEELKNYCIECSHLVLTLKQLR